jgi:gluconate 2-dehydrogenase gamma chain
MSKRNVKKHGIPRRSLLVHSASGAGAAWVASHWPGILAAQEHVRRETDAGRAASFEFFSPEQAVEVESMAARIIPTDDTPGAREAKVIYFIDRALTTFDRDKQPLYTQGLRDLLTKTRELFPSADKFSSLTSAQQIQLLTAIERAPFFEQVRLHTIIGFFADPKYGGNRDKIGWKLIGFEDKFHWSPPFSPHYKQG